MEGGLPDDTALPIGGPANDHGSLQETTAVTFSREMDVLYDPLQKIQEDGAEAIPQKLIEYVSTCSCAVVVITCSC